MVRQAVVNYCGVIEACDAISLGQLTLGRAAQQGTLYEARAGDATGLVSTQCVSREVSLRGAGTLMHLVKP